LEIAAVFNSGYDLRYPALIAFWRVEIGGEPSIPCRNKSLLRDVNVWIRAILKPVAIALANYSRLLRLMRYISVLVHLGAFRTGLLFL